jgi:hypothetical protein
MGYLVLRDYAQYIQGDYLRQLTQGSDVKRTTEENTSLQAIAQRLTQKYDLTTEFTETKPYKTSNTYGAASRITIDVSTGGFSAWVASTAYTVGALVIYNSVGYYCITSNTDATFTPAKWATVGAQHSIYYAAYPYTCTVNGLPNPATLMQPYAPVFNYKTLYDKGDIVFWKGHTYVCNSASTVITHQAALQYAQYTNMPYNNVFPDDPVTNAHGQYWGTKTVYTVPAGTLTGKLYDAAATYAVNATIMGPDGDILVCITAIAVAEPFNAAKWATLWVLGDNRNQTIKDAMVRITVFKLSPLISPRNTPDVWLDDYRSILRELNEAAEGRITMNLPLRQPNNATRTYNGGNVKNVNNY